ncbi:MAG: hypothetical protein F8N15_09140 [Methanobacterium sp.]|nr:hypothetical protein [Methanobacterium sp.]
MIEPLTVFLLWNFITGIRTASIVVMSIPFHKFVGICSRTMFNSY